MLRFTGPADDGTPADHPPLRGRGTISLAAADGGWQPTFMWSGQARPAPGHPRELPLTAGAEVRTPEGTPLLEFRMRGTRQPAYSFGHTLGGRLPAGAYTVEWWTARDDDGTRVGGSFGFEFA
ncbi:hypothetical protein J7F03_19905 [Streptomyces sp. ISL-43]|uniref:hypothetical protein n=1 Tax=Streptomyces sp. ISL-43 TaxID=2819183 RepID=UPI001BEA3619|nr:hypothetical protein [Streptomyces sp. ISL-43]MBT2449315.1 hypothetical protein [Streptomyces sp. ISL-43]